jgi:serine/threonine protein kinase/Tol biopolymer transport system component
MTPKRWQQIDKLLQAALERDPQQRAAFLDAACQGDQALRQEVESLLGSQAGAEGFLNSPAVENAAALLADQPGDSLLGRRLGSYQILALLGSGGMGEVYLAQDTRLGRRVALKLLPPFFTQDEQRLRRFQQEARAASALNHPNIITIFDIGQTDGLHFMVTEYIEGETLRAAMHKGLTLDRALDAAMQTAGALQAAHQAGIAHRDVKPENIMLRSDGYVKVLDFGLAKLTEKAALTGDTQAATVARVETDPGMVMGTASYMSPEQARGLKVDPRTDIFSLGVVLYEMIAGRLPFAGETASDVMAAILDKQPLPLARFAPDAPSEIQWIVTRALRKDRDERYQTVREMLGDLREVKHDLDAQARAERRAAPETSGKVTGQPPSQQNVAERTNQLAAATGTVATRTTSSAEIILSEIKRHKTGAALTLAALVLIIAGIVFALYKFFGPSKPEPTHAPKFTALTSGGKVGDLIIDGDVTISPDGKYITYAVFDDKRQMSLWVKQVSTNSQAQIVPPANVFFQGTSFSRDGEFVYYVTFDRINRFAPALYRVPVIGGTSTLVMRNVWSPPGFSPDGRRFAVIRHLPERTETEILIANTDSSVEPSVLTSIKAPDYLADETAPSWSPDGKLIACAMKSHAGEETATIVGVSVADGKLSRLTSENWGDMARVLWLEDGSGLIFTASTAVNQIGLQIWFLPYPEGKARRITNDLNGYGGSSLGVTADSSTIATIQARESSRVVVLSPNEDESHARQVTPGGRTDGTDGLSWTPDGRIVYSARDGDNSDLWMVNADGTGRRQLTADAYWEHDATVSPDGRYIVFQSERAGNLNLWRIDADGNNPKQLTEGNAAEANPVFSPDGQWVVFMRGSDNKPTVWKVNINGGAPVQLTDQFSLNPVVSPDGKWIAYGSLEEQPGNPPRPRLHIIAFEGGKPLKTIDLPASIVPERGGIQWTPDGQAICYAAFRAGMPNLWAQPIDGGPPKPLTDFKSDFIYRYAFSRDGKQIAVARGIDTKDLVLIKDFR